MRGLLTEPPSQVRQPLRMPRIVELARPHLGLHPIAHRFPPPGSNCASIVAAGGPLHPISKMCIMVSATLQAVACRVEPVVTHPASPQTRTCAIHAYGSSGRATAARWQSSGFQWSGLVSSMSLPCFLPAEALPDGACPPVGPLGLRSPRAPVRYAARRPPGPPRGASLVARHPESLAGFPRACDPLPARRPVEARGRRQGRGSAGPPFRHLNQETGGSPTCPSSPCDDRPRAQTPRVSWALALARPGLLPSSACTPSAFPSKPP